MALWKSVVGKLWMTIIGLVLVVLFILSLFLLDYIDTNFEDAYDVKRLFIYTGVIGFLLTTFFAFFLSTRITQPLRQMKKAADMIMHGEYRTRVPIISSDEIGQLARTFNQMAEELEQTIRDLNHEKEQLSSMLRSMADAVITFDSSGEVVLTNPLGLAIMQQWNGLDWLEESPAAGISIRVPEPLHELFNSVIAGKRDLTSTLHVQQGVWSVIMAPIFADGSVRGAVAVLRDVTEEFKLEKLRRDFVANVSHEIRTPLSMLQGYSEALLDDIAPSPEERRELVQVIHDESLRMGRLVKDLLDLARMEAGHIELRHEKVDVPVLLERVYRKFQALAKERGIGLHLDMSHDEHDERVLLDADSDRLEQVLTNLLDNALRHTSSERNVFIRFSTVMQSGAPWLTIKVEDEGDGIPNDDLPYIFERFYKADKARTRGSGGTGLGLAIVKNIIDAHHGSIQAKSVLGEGTSFLIKLPVNRQDAS